MTKSEVLKLLDGLKDEFKGLAQFEIYRQTYPGLNKTFHEGKEKAYYVAIDVIDDAERMLKKEEL